MEITSQESQRQTQRDRRRETCRFPPGRAGRGDKWQGRERRAGQRKLTGG